jgi:hypothetical protein
MDATSFRKLLQRGATAWNKPISNLMSLGWSHFPTCFLIYSPVSYDKYIYKSLKCSTTTSQVC